MTRIRIPVFEPCQDQRRGNLLSGEHRRRARVCQEIAADIRTRYTVGYAPGGDERYGIAKADPGEGDGAGARKVDRADAHELPVRGFGESGVAGASRRISASSPIRLPAQR